MFVVLLGAACGHRLVAHTRCPAARSRPVRSCGEQDTVKPSAARDPISVIAAAQFLADEMGDQMALRTGAGRSALFLASLIAPGALPNAFATARWQSRVYTARTQDGRVVGAVQTALANVALAGARTPRTVRFFQNVVVARAWRRRGVATLLLDFADTAEDCRFDAALAVEPENEAAVELYCRRGFKLVESEPERQGTRLMIRS